MKLLFLKSLFVPEQRYININIDTMTNFVNYLKKSSHKYQIITIKFVGWISQNIDRSVIIDRIASIVTDLEVDNTYQNIAVEYELWGENLGKGYLLKNITTIHPSYRTYNHVMYADHDISPIDDILQDRFIVGNRVDNSEIALVSFDMTPDNRHNDTIYQNVITLYDRDYYYNKDNVRIASGCFITIPKIIKLLADIKIDNNSVYGEEDIALGTLLNELGYCNLVSKLKVNHPYEQDKEYASWKIGKIIQIVKKRECPDINVDIMNNDYWSCKSK